MSIFEHNRPWSNEIKEKVKNADQDELLLFFNELDAKWTVSRENIILDSCNRLNIRSIDHIDTSILQMELEKAIFEATLIYTKFKKSMNKSKPENK